MKRFAIDLKFSNSSAYRLTPDIEESVTYATSEAGARRGAPPTVNAIRIMRSVRSAAHADRAAGEDSATPHTLEVSSGQRRQSKLMATGQRRKNTGYGGGVAAADSISDRSGAWVPHGSATT